MIDDFLLSDWSLTEVSPEIHSVLSPEERGALYDPRPTAYDQVVGSWLYNRLVWGVSTKAYHRFVRRALSVGEGPLLDAGAGSAVFTAEAYAKTSRPMILVDRAAGMLEAARDRIAKRAGGSLPGRLTLLQADATELPLQSGSVETVLSMGLLHLVEDMAACAEELFRVLRPGGALFATSLVTDRAFGRQYLRLLHKVGEVATPRSQAELRKRIESTPRRSMLGGPSVEVEREGNMAFLKAEKPTPLPKMG